MAEKDSLYTVGRIRTECISLARSYMQGGNPSDYKHMRLESERYYDSLEDGSDAKNDLKKKWDALSYDHKNIIDEWNNKYKESNPLDRHDLWELKLQLLFSYEMERFICMEHNYLYFKTYWDM